MTTNYERIKNMTVGEMAYWLSSLTRKIGSEIFKMHGIDEDFNDLNLTITRDYFQWLQSESEEQ